MIAIKANMIYVAVLCIISFLGLSSVSGHNRLLPTAPIFRSDVLVAVQHVPNVANSALNSFYMNPGYRYNIKVRIGDSDTTKGGNLFIYIFSKNRYGVEKITEIDYGVNCYKSWIRLPAVQNTALFNPMNLDLNPYNNPYLNPLNLKQPNLLRPYEQMQDMISNPLKQTPLDLNPYDEYERQLTIDVPLENVVGVSYYWVRGSSISGSLSNAIGLSQNDPITVKSVQFIPSDMYSQGQAMTFCDDTRAKAETVVAMKMCNQGYGNNNNNNYNPNSNGYYNNGYSNNMYNRQ